MLDEIISLAKKAGEAILKHYRHARVITRKKDNSPLTAADLEANHIICEGLRCLNSKIPIISEEVPFAKYTTRKKWRRFWLVDPLDGTREFLKHSREFTVNIALIERGRPVLGVVYAPALKKLYYAGQTRGAYRRFSGKNHRIFFKPPQMNQKVILLESKFHRQHGVLPHKLVRRGVVVKRVGSSLKFCLLAEGSAHLYIRKSPTMEWDVAAGDCIFRYASKTKENASPLKYNKRNLKNGGFVLGQV